MSLDQVTAAQLEAMIGRDAEGQQLEFKVDIPVHDQSQNEQRRAGIISPRDSWWNGKSYAAHGRDRLLEEVVAFANAQGGRLILGMDEDGGTTVASAICPLPRVAELEAAFRNSLLSCVEPRLPQVACKAIETDGEGRGVLVFDVEQSRIGPHRVMGTLQVPIRRGDKCLNASMPEVHEMVLRNARRFDEVNRAIDTRAVENGREFERFLISKIGSEIAASTNEQKIEAWLRIKQVCSLAVRIVICAHDDIGVTRLSTLDPLIPPQNCIVSDTAQGRITSREMGGLWMLPGRSEKFLGGARQRFPWDSGLLDFEARREGLIQATLFLIGPAGELTWTPDELAGLLACSLGAFDKLRTIADRPDMPAEVSISMLARGQIKVAASRQPRLFAGGSLPDKAEFPRRTVSSAADFSEILNLTAQDLLDAGNVAGNLAGNLLYIPS